MAKDRHEHSWQPYSLKAIPTNVSPSYWVLQIVVCAVCMETKSIVPEWNPPQHTSKENNEVDNE